MWLFSTKINQIFLLEPKRTWLELLLPFFFLAIHWYMSLQKREENVERRSFGSRVASKHKKDDPISSLSRVTFGFAILRKGKLAITVLSELFFTKCQSQWWWSKTPHKLLAFLPLLPTFWVISPWEGKKYFTPCRSGFTKVSLLIKSWFFLTNQKSLKVKLYSV